MDKPGIDGKEFKITIGYNWFNQYPNDTIKFVKKSVLKWIGFYNSYKVQILDEPIPLFDGFSYNSKFVSCTKYAFWIPYKTIRYD